MVNRLVPKESINNRAKREIPSFYQITIMNLQRARTSKESAKQGARTRKYNKSLRAPKPPKITSSNRRGKAHEDWVKCERRPQIDPFTGDPRSSAYWNIEKGIY